MRSGRASSRTPVELAKKTRGGYVIINGSLRRDLHDDFFPSRPWSKGGRADPRLPVTKGFEVVIPALPNGDFEEAVRVAQDAFNQYRPAVVLGASRGGAVAMALDSKCAPLELIAPAWRKWGSVTSVKPSTLILHSEHDAIIPIDDSRELVSNSG